ncbi:Jerky-like protein, partial [Stegodyphus mimosarum]
MEQHFMIRFISIPLVEKFFKSKNLPRKQSLILDNALSHPNAEQFRNEDIRAMSLPPNVTSVSQPMDQEVLEALKKKYRCKLLLSLVLAMEEGCDMIEKLKKIGCEEVTDGHVEEWVGQDENCEVLGHTEIVALVKDNVYKNEDESENEENKGNGKAKMMTHGEGLRAAEGMLRYMEEQAASDNEILLKKHVFGNNQEE